jgi:pimeloyl-ACP methyl ester carboxylesterase
MFNTVSVDGIKIFYREAGPADGPTVLLLHGFPTSSHMYRGLIPLLADKYHVIAPDLPGFGFSDVPPRDKYRYTFDNLAKTIDAFTQALQLKRYAIQVFDYGAPVGLRLAVAHPERITAIITQNGNGYEEGFVKPFWDGVFAYTSNPGPETEAAMRGALTLESTRWQYVNGVADPSLVSPDNWLHDQALLDRPGNDKIQLKLFRDYPTNVDLYPRLHQYFRDSRVPLLAVWGAGDEIFGPAGAEAFRQDLPDAEIHLIDSGHFALESHLATITGHIRDFLGRVLA